MRFTNNPEFKALLATKKLDIYQRTNDGIQESLQFQKLKSLLLEARRKYAESDYRHILITKDDLLTLCGNAEEKVIELYTTPTFITNRTVFVNSQLEILNCNNDPFPENNNDARHYFENISKDNLVGFLIAPDATLHYFIDGKDFGDGVFYTSEARKGYEELRTIEHLEEVLNEYRINLQHQDTYVKFFVPRSGLKALHALKYPNSDSDEFVKNNNYLLRNKPEECFREDIRNFIKRNMRVVVSREVTLENLDRLDIELTDEAGRDLYFIEIKWVGKSINANGDSFGTEYKAKPRINPDAINQVVGYIDELLKDNQNVKVGYLVVFDARKEDLPDTCSGVTKDVVSENIRHHFARFQKLPDFRVKNTNPR